MVIICPVLRHTIPSTEQQATSKEQRERELAASAFQELDDDMDGT